MVTCDMLIDFLIEIEDKVRQRLACAEPESLEARWAKFMLDDLSDRLCLLRGKCLVAGFSPAMVERNDRFREYNALIESTRPEDCKKHYWYLSDQRGTR
jgi:hypothetical protein